VAWPLALTVDADITSGRYVQEQGLDRTLETGDFTALHQGVSEEVRNWVESKGGISDADKITNTSIFKPAAAHLFVSKVIANRDIELSRYYGEIYAIKLREACAKVSVDIASGGTVAKVVLRKQGNATYFTGRRSGAVFGNRRGS